MESLPNHHLLEFQPDMIEAIRKRYNLDNPRNMADALEVLETWMKQQNHFLKKDHDRSYLEKTLVSCKGSMEKSKLQIDKLCTMKTLLPNFFKECNVKEHFKSLLEIVTHVPLPKPTKDFYRIIMFRSNNKPFTASDVFDYFRLCIVISEYLKLHDYYHGLIIIYDLREISLLDILNKTNLVEMQQFLRIITEGYGTRLKAIHMISNSRAIEYFVKTIKSLLSAKIGDRIYVHSSNEEIMEVVSKDLLPLDYGGAQKPIEELQREWVEELSKEKFREYLKMVYAARTNEMYRQTDKFYKDFLGMPGSFRSLSVD